MAQLLFGTGGIPRSAAEQTNEHGVLRCAELGLGCMELEFVYGVRINDEQAAKTRAAAAANGIALSCHAPYYINLNSKEEEKVAASVARILHAARKGAAAGADQVVFHAAFYMGDDPETVYRKVKKQLTEIRKKLVKESLGHVTLRPELTGKPSHFGTLEELIRLSHEVEGVLPCIDFSHYYARYAGRYNKRDDFCLVLETLAEELGEPVLQKMHIHLSGIEFTPKGERKHLEAADSGFEYREVLRVLKQFGAGGRVICESPNIEEDAVLFKKTYEKLKITNKTTGAKRKKGHE
jgi:deoxyribonuclease IV